MVLLGVVGAAGGTTRDCGGAAGGTTWVVGGGGCTKK